MKLRWTEYNLMTVVASVVVLLYTMGVIYRRSPNWYEWVGAAAGAGFCVWFWSTELRRAQRRRTKGRQP